MRKFLTLLCILIGLHSNSQTVVINEVYGAGGNSGATRTHDFIELYNNTASEVIMTDWSIQYTSSGGTSWGSNKLIFSGKIPANGYFLIQLASGGTAGTALPAADATGSINMSGTSGKVILCNNNVSASANTNPTDLQIIDKVAYGSSTPMEGSPAPALTPTTSVQRLPIGSDTNDNFGDFQSGTPSPTNSGSGNTTTITVSAGTAASEAPTTGTFIINFSAATTAQTTVNFAYTGSATFNTDYSIAYSAGSPSNADASGTLTVPTGTSSITVSVEPVNDVDVEGTETVTLTLSSPATGYTLGTAAASINITDNDAPPSVSVAAGINAAEPATNGTFQFTLSSVAPAGGVTISYTLSGTASSSDYSDPQSGTITIPAGASSGTATMNVSDDPDGEPVETIILTINTVTSPYVISGASASINITSNDFTPIPLSGIYSQDFNSLAITGTTNVLSLQGWLLNETGGSLRDNEQYGADNGGSNTGDTYSYGTAATTERALGALQSGTLISTFGSFYTNNTGTTITKLRVTYTGEQWRLGATGRNDRLDFQYSVDAANITSGTWTDVNGLDFIAPNSLGTVGPLDGNNSANKNLVSFDIIGISIPNGGSFAIRWNDFNASGADDGLSIDDLSVEANPIDLTPPIIISLAPLNGAANVPTNGSATMVFDEPVQKGTGNIIIKRTLDNSIFQTLDVSSTSVMVNSTTVTFPLSGLTANTGYYITIDNGAFEDLSGNDFAGISSSSTWAFTTGTIFYTANFNACTGALTDGFSQYSVTGVLTWACTSFGRDPSAPSGTLPSPNGVQMNGFSGGTNVPNEDWLISPSFNLSGTTYPLLSFWSRTAFNGQPLQLKVSTDYVSGDPSLATWTDLNGKFPQQTSNTWTLSENINLTAYKNSNVHFAFVYFSDDDEGARWTLDDVRLDDSPTPPPPSLTVSTTDIQFAYTAAGTTTNKTFSFIGNDLTNEVSLTATGTFSLSKNGTDFSSSITYSVAEVNNIPTTVHVRFAPAQNNQDFSGGVTVSTGDITASINLSGTSIDPVTTLEVVNWNVEWFGSTAEGPTNENLQEQNVRTILQNLKADVYALTEIVSEEKLASVVSQMSGYSYVLSNYGSHTNTTVNPPSALASAQKLAFIYKTSVLSNISTTALLSQGINSSADINSNPAYNYWASGRFPYMMSADVTLNCVTKHVKFILVHAKANTAPTAGSYDRRKRGVDTLYYTINQLYPNDNIVILGDFNDDLDKSITDGFVVTSWSTFTNDAVNYEPLTLPLSLAGKKSTVSYNDVIDHVIVSSEFEGTYMTGSANILSDVSSLVSNYGSTTSDHYPVFTRYRFNNTTPPSATPCVNPAPFCVNNSGNYTIPAFVATDDCGDVVTYSYSITGATQRSGNGNDASGAFSPGTSVVKWTATDSWGNSSNCEISVVVNTNPSVAIPDTFVLSSGVLANTVYIGYAPASSITLSAVASGGAPAYSYNWSSGSTNANATVSPISTTVYTVTVTDANNCQASANKTVNVLDIRRGNKNKQVVVCHTGNSLTVGQDEVATHLSHGDMLGACTSNPARTWPQHDLVSGNGKSQLAVQALPNPSSGSFRIAIQTGNTGVPVNLRVTDLVGRIIEQKNVPGAGAVLTIGAAYKPGIYLVELSQGDQRETLKLVKL